MENKFYISITPEQLTKLQKLSTNVHKEEQILLINSNTNGCTVYIFEGKIGGKLKYSANYFMYVVYLLIGKLAGTIEEQNNIIKGWLDSRSDPRFENIVDYVYDYYETMVAPTLVTT